MTTVKDMLNTFMENHHKLHEAEQTTRSEQAAAQQRSTDAIVALTTKLEGAMTATRDVTAENTTAIATLTAATDERRKSLVGKLEHLDSCTDETKALVRGLDAKVDAHERDPNPRGRTMMVGGGGALGGGGIIAAVGALGKVLGWY